MIKKLFIAVSAVLILGIYQLPNIYAYTHTPLNDVFLGQASWFDPWDINVYVSSIHYAQRNGFLLQNVYTTTPNKPIVFYPVYSLIGVLFKTVNPFFLFHFFASLIGVCIILSLFIILRKHITNLYERTLVIIGICIGGGLGFLVYPLFGSSDSSITSFTFHSAFQRPHEGVGLILYILSLYLGYLWITTKNKNYILYLIGALSACVVIYPYYLLSICLILVVFSFFYKRKEWIYYSFQLAPAVLCGVAAVYFTFSQLLANSTFSSVLAQHLSTPNILLICAGYGVSLILIIPQLFNSKKNSFELFLVCWFVVCLLLTFFPAGFSRFYLRGLFFPLIILAVKTIRLFFKENVASYYISLAIFIFFVSLTNIYICTVRLKEAFNNSPWYYATKQEYAGINFLNKTKNESGVLALYSFSNILPAHTKNRVYFGHLIQTPDVGIKITNANKFYKKQMSEEEAKNFLKQNNISYVIFGRREKAEIGSDFLPYSFLKQVFINSDITIYSP